MNAQAAQPNANSNSQVKSVVLHKLVKEAHGKSEISPRNSALVLTEPVKKLVADIENLYAEKANKGYGRFEDDDITYPASKVLRSVFVSKKASFINGSQQLLKILAARADDATLSTGGYVLMAHMTEQGGTSWFLVAIINNIDGRAVNDESLDVVEVAHIDMNSLRVAGRVNLTEWLGENNKRYIGFLKHRGQVADYFKKFLGCSETTKNSEETDNLVKALKDFSIKEKLLPQKREHLLAKAYDYCLEQLRQSEPVSLDELANTVWPSAPRKLQKALGQSTWKIGDGFLPDAKAMRSLVRIRAKTQYWSLDLNRHAFMTGDARYNNAKGELVLRNLPDDLRADLDAELSDGT